MSRRNSFAQILAPTVILTVLRKDLASFVSGQMLRGYAPHDSSEVLPHLLRKEPHNKSVSRTLTALLTILLSLACMAALKPGDDLPDLSSFQLEGKLPDHLKGQVILLDFWASWCTPCERSFPAMEELTKKYADQGLTIVAVSVDEKPENMQRFLKSVNVSFTVIRDAQHKLVAAADIPSMPTSFLIDRSGKIRFIHPGFDRDETTRQYVKEIEQLLKESKQ